MNCQTVQNDLLGSEDPGRPEASVQAHLDHCPECRDWQRRLIGLETAVKYLPVPPSPNRRAALIDTILHPPIRSLTPASLPRWKRYGTVLQLAAAVLILGFCGAVLLWQPWSRPPQATAPVHHVDPLLATLVQRNLALAHADSPEVRLEALRKLADDLNQETTSLAIATALDDLQALASWYDQVVRQGVLPQAGAVSPADRPAMLGPVVQELTRVDAAAVQLAKDYPAAADPLRRMATTARTASHTLTAADFPANVSSRRPDGPPKATGEEVEHFFTAAMPAVKPVADPVFQPQPLPPPAIVEQVQRFHRNRELIDTLVDSGLRLARRPSPIDRAETCHELAERLAQEMRHAARDREGGRAAELGNYLNNILERGVADNLAWAGNRIPHDSPGNQELLRVGQRVVQMTQPLEDDLQQAARSETQPADMQRALNSVNEGRDEVIKVLRERGLLPRRELNE